jgi:hypothetical protein
VASSKDVNQVELTLILKPSVLATINNEVGGGERLYREAAVKAS